MPPVFPESQEATSHCSALVHVHLTPGDEIELRRRKSARLCPADCRDGMLSVNQERASFVRSRGFLKLRKRPAAVNPHSRIQRRSRRNMGKRLARRRATSRNHGGTGGARQTSEADRKPADEAAGVPPSPLFSTKRIFTPWEEGGRSPAPRPRCRRHAVPAHGTRGQYWRAGVLWNTADLIEAPQVIDRIGDAEYAERLQQTCCSVRVPRR